MSARDISQKNSEADLDVIDADASRNRTLLSIGIEEIQLLEKKELMLLQKTNASR
ncbi:UNVERIFIED_ORG: hypothetical protein HNP28_003222 [Comamonas terrigena]